MEKYRIEISHCDWAENPFEAWDCEPELMYQYGRESVNDCSDGGIVEFIKQFPTDGQIIKHQKVLCDILEIDHGYLCERELTKDEKADEIRWEITSSLRVDQLAKLCELFKIPHLNYESSGYSQGDWCDVLLVCTDEFFKTTGCKRKDADEILKGSKKLFDAWAWGDVYQFTVEKATEVVKLTKEDYNAGKFENLEEVLEWDYDDSCGGFYGEDVESIADHSGAPIEVVKDAFYYENRGEWVEYEK